MDFSKFRTSGNLSDIVVVVNGQENHLHRFPLYAKCDYFCGVGKETGLVQLSAAYSGKCRVVLDDFPGGQTVFSLVADFCYNMAPLVTKDNVVQVRCAAHFLQMAGPGNLADTADKFLQDAIASARLSRSACSLVSLLLHCASVGRLAQECGVVDACSDALVETWLLHPSGKLSSSSSTCSTSSSSAPSSNPAARAPAGALGSARSPGGKIALGLGPPHAGSAFTSLQGSGSAFTATKPSAVVGGSRLAPTASASSGSSGGDGPKSAGSSSSLFTAVAVAAAPTVVDEPTLRNLCRLPQEWFATLLKRAVERGVRSAGLVEMAVRYVTQALDKDSAAKDAAGSGRSGSRSRSTASSGDRSRARPGRHHGDRDGSGMAGDSFLPLAGACHSPPVLLTQNAGAFLAPLGELNVEDLDKDVDTSAEAEGLEEAESGEDGGSENGSTVDPAEPYIPDRPSDIGQLLDAVLTVFPEDAFSVAPVSIEWLTKVLRIATARGCACRRFLVGVAADKLSRLPVEELCHVSPSVLHDIVLQGRAQVGGSDDKSATARSSSEAERACALVDTYLGEMARKGVLTSDTYRLLAGAAPPGVPRNHDHLYTVLEHVLHAEKDSVSTEQCQELLATINFDLVTEDTLKKALDSGFALPDLVARAALKLCHGLRSELDSVKYIAQMQEEELNKCQPSSQPPGAATYTLPLPLLDSYTRPDHLVVLAPKLESDSGFSDATCGHHESASSAGLRHGASRDTMVPERDASGYASDSVRAAQSVLSTARSKLALPLYAGHRPYLPSSGLDRISSGLGSGLEHDVGPQQDELELRLDRATAFRSLEPRVRSRHLPHHYTTTSSSTASSSTASSSSRSASDLHGHLRSTYFPYSPRHF